MGIIAFQHIQISPLQYIQCPP